MKAKIYNALEKNPKLFIKKVRHFFLLLITINRNKTEDLTKTLSMSFLKLITDGLNRGGCRAKSTKNKICLSEKQSI